MRRFSICSSSLLVYCTRVSFVTPLNDVGHRLAELLCNITVGKVRVLDNIVQKRRNYRVLVKPHIGRYIRRRDSVGDIGRAVLAKLPGMGELLPCCMPLLFCPIHIHAAVGYFSC